MSDFVFAGIAKPILSTIRITCGDAFKEVHVERKATAKDQGATSGRAVAASRETAWLRRCDVDRWASVGEGEGEMNVFDTTTLFTAHCKACRVWGLKVSFHDDDDFAEVLKAAPYLLPLMQADGCGTQAVSEGVVFLFFEDEAEMRRHYRMTVGDDGPTDLNTYDGPARVYAVTCSPDGRLLGENT